MSPKIFYQVSSILFGIVAVAHSLRILFNISVYIGDYRIPLKVSFLGVLVAGYLAYCAYGLANNKKKKK